MNCGTCKWWEMEPIDRGYVCVNGDSEYCADWRERNFCCDKWEGKMTQKENCSLCKHYKPLILRNKNRRPDYGNTSGCCTLPILDEVYQITNPEKSMCECWEGKG